MTIIQVNQVEDFLRSLQPNSGVYVDIYGYVIRMEERIDKSSHIGKTLRVHPGNDTLAIALKDVLAMVKDEGKEIVKN
jgi:hypothetical protein